jgi:hypothetical protein
MNVWYVIPSARPWAEVLPCLESWQKKGYFVAIQRDSETDKGNSVLQWGEEIWIHKRPYAGYPEAVNFLCRETLARDPEAAWIVTGGDDVYPDPTKTAAEIGAECSAHFGLRRLNGKLTYSCDASTFGVMQPTGDRWGANEPWALKMYPDSPAYIDRICGSPWMGREFVARMYGGRGPFCEEYRHMFCDEELQNVAKLLGVFHQRPDLVHFHDHWGRKQGNVPIPQHLAEVNTAAHWTKYKKIFDTRKAAGFPGHEPIQGELTR